MNRSTTGALFGVGIIWGASFLFIKIALDHGLRPIEIVVVRTLTGAVVLNVFVWLGHRRLPLDRRIAPAILGMSLLGHVLPFFMIAWAQTRLDSGPVAVLNATMPIFASLFAAAVLYDERLTLRTFAGVAIGLLGAAVLTGSSVFDIGSSHALAQLAVIGASAAYAASGVVVRLSVRDYDPIGLSAVNITVAASASLLIAMVVQPPRLYGTAEAWAAMLALGALGTGAAYVLYYWLISQVGAVRSSLVTYIIPVVGVTLGALVLSEPVRWNTFAGGLIIVAGVAIGTGMFGRVAVPAKPRGASVHP